MDTRRLADLSCLSNAQKALLAKGKFNTVADFLVKTPKDAAKQCGKSKEVAQMDAMMNAISKELFQPPCVLGAAFHDGEAFTTGDTEMDSAFGGGIRTGMVWEICGEPRVGKTLLALQLSLYVQLPPLHGGVSGSTFFISTGEDLLTETERLYQMLNQHPRLFSEHCSLRHVHFRQVFNYKSLENMLEVEFPRIAAHNMSTEGAKPIKLLVIDLFSDLFDVRKHPQYDDLPLRARHLRKIGQLAHKYAQTHNLSVVFLGGTRPSPPRIAGGDSAPDRLRYSDQARWFARAHSGLVNEDTNEGVLGHVWPNQLNARAMLSRTLRTVDIEDVEYTLGRACRGRDSKPPLRRLSVIFSSAAPPASCDYVILDEGLVGFTAGPPPPSPYPATTPPYSASEVSSLSGTQTPTTSSSSRWGSDAGSPWYQQSLSYASSRSSDGGAQSPLSYATDPSVYHSFPESSSDYAATSTSYNTAPASPVPSSSAPSPPLTPSSTATYESDDEEQLWRAVEEDGIDDVMIAQMVDEPMPDAIHFLPAGLLAVLDEDPFTPEGFDEEPDRAIDATYWNNI